MGADGSRPASPARLPLPAGPPLLVTVSGLKKSGKTTAAEALVAGLLARGFSTGAVKSIRHAPLPLDRPGTDTWRLARAGAALVIGQSPHETLCLERHAAPPALRRAGRAVPGRHPGGGQRGAGGPAFAGLVRGLPGAARAAGGDRGRPGAARRARRRPGGAVRGRLLCAATAPWLAAAASRAPPGAARPGRLPRFRRPLPRRPGGLCSTCCWSGWAAPFPPGRRRARWWRTPPGAPACPPEPG